jgi:hypothetical protein
MRYLILLLLVSCTATKIQKSEALLARTGVLPQICMERYPVAPKMVIVKDSLVKYDTIVATEYLHDTLTFKDTFYTVKYKPLTIIKEVTKVKTEVVVDRAMESLLKSRITQLEADNSNLTANVSKYKGRSKTLLNWLLIALAAFVGYSIRKPFSSLLKWYFPKLKL